MLRFTLSPPVLCLASALAFAQVTPPSQFQLQGRLTDNAGQPVTSTARDLRVEFYDSAIGGLLLGTSAVVDPAITNGVYAVSLTIPAGMCANNAAVFMELAVGNGAAGPDGAFEVLSPRTRVLASAYALNADTLDGRDSSFFAQASGSFVQNGNAFGALATLGTNDAFDLAFEANGAEVFRATTAGRVGIGTTTPSVALQVVGQTRSSSFSSADGTEGLPAYRFENDTDVGMYLPAANSLGLTTGGVERLRIDASGRVGVGTAAPAGRLDVQDGGLTLVLGADNLAGTRTNATDKLTRITGAHFTNAEEPVMVAMLENQVAANVLSLGGGSGLANSATTIRLMTAATTTTTSGSERMRIDPAGNVGIGTTSPDHLLHIAGSMRLDTTFPFRFGLVNENTDEINFTRANPAADRSDLTLTLGDNGWTGALGGEEHFIISATNVGRLLDLNTNRGLEIANRLKIFASGDQTTNFVPNSCAGNYVVGGGIVEFLTDPGGG